MLRITPPPADLSTKQGVHGPNNGSTTHCLLLRGCEQTPGRRAARSHRAASKEHLGLCSAHAASRPSLAPRAAPWTVRVLACAASFAVDCWRESVSLTRRAAPCLRRILHSSAAYTRGGCTAAQRWAVCCRLFEGELPLACTRRKRGTARRVLGSVPPPPLLSPSLRHSIPVCMLQTFCTCRIMMPFGYNSNMAQSCQWRAQGAAVAVQPDFRSTRRRRRENFSSVPLISWSRSMNLIWMFFQI
jgi:hypothetical protein